MGMSSLRLTHLALSQIGIMSLNQPRPKIVIAPDSFKDSLSAAVAARALARGVTAAIPSAEVVICPMADGGEGTLDSILAGATAHAEASPDASSLLPEVRYRTVAGPLGDPVSARWLWIPSSKTAFVELAQASGIELLTRAQRNATRTTTRGTGELISAALEAGAENIVLAIGGSATNDAGAGMLRALGAGLLDTKGHPLDVEGGLALARVGSIDLSGLDPRIGALRSFTVAADVDNPLCGPTGASAVYGPQKGASPAEVEVLDAALKRFADCVQEAVGSDVRDDPGCGAAGGVGFAARAVLSAQFRSGAAVVADLVGLTAAVRGADLIITGEGCCDAQSARGKVPYLVARTAAEQRSEQRQHQSGNDSIALLSSAPAVLVIAGALGTGYEELYAHGVTAAFSLCSAPMTLERACAEAETLLEQRARDVARMWAAARGII